MKSIGLIGGIAPESTIDYYRKLIALYQQKLLTPDYPNLIINSINMTKMLQLVGEEKNDELIEFLLLEINKLFRSGAEVAALASNTPHVVFDELNAISPIKLVSIVESTCNTAVELNVKKVALFGTKFTMTKGFYQRVFAKANIQISIPRHSEMDYIHEKYMDELVKGIFMEKTRQRFIEILDGIYQNQKIEALVLGGTEIPFILRPEDYPQIEMMNTTQIHVNALIKELMGE